MPFGESRPITFVHAQVYSDAGVLGSSLRVAGDRVAGLNVLPEPGDAVIDLEGDSILPGFINAHDHLELNNFPRMKWRERYTNASQWIADFQPRFKTDPALVKAMSIPLADRLLLGGIKNLLCGATTVCHHNPLYRCLQREFPVRVVRRYRFSHSILIDGEAARKSYRKTPFKWPWIIHAAEGTDQAASDEFTLLERWGCVGPNTLLVHGVGLDQAAQATLAGRGGGLIWCPTSNDFLLSATINISALGHAHRVALGTDSRLSGERDLLAEIKFAATHHGVSAENLLRMVTVDAASLLKLPDAGVLRRNAPADFFVLPGGAEGIPQNILSTDRARIRLVVLGGRAQVGDADMRPAFAAAGIRWVEAGLDGSAKVIDKTIADKMRLCRVQEPGLEL
jgi:cytosine/adenosine deaminase-related metal-dependent hydrolase